jgi:hypothetical protein
VFVAVRGGKSSPGTNVFWLARLLIVEKYRRLLAQYGKAGSLSLAAMLLALGWACGEAMGRLGRNVPPMATPAFWNHVWIAWVAAAVFLGKDLTWHIRIDRLKAFPVPGFVRLYAVTVLLSLVSFPLWVMLLVFWIATSTQGRGCISCVPAVVAAYILFVVSIRSTASLTQSALYRSSGLPKNLRRFVLVFIPVLIGWMALPVVQPAIGAALPGYHLGLVLTSAGNLRPLLLLSVIVLPLSIVDSAVLHGLTYSGICGPPAPGNRLFSGGSLLLMHAGWPPPLWRISFLGWLRNRSSLLLLLWGGSYGFLYMYFSKPEETFDYMAFSWMAQVFHSHLRGNLLGVDHRAVWFYYMLPAPVRTCVQAKNQTLSVIQGSMVAAVLLPGLIHPAPAMDLAAWLRILSYAYSSILVGEISGSILSLRYPEPIERSSHFSAGMAAGGLIVPFLQILFLAVFLTATALTRLFLPPVLLWLELVFTPALLIAIRSLLLPGLLQKTMLNRRTNILAGLSVFSS